MELMHFAEELVSVDDLEPPKKSEIGDKELQMARQLIESLAAEFKPENYHNEYTAKVQALIDRKAEGQEIVTEPAVVEAKGKVIDLMAALEQSLAKAGKRKTERATEKSDRKKRKSA